MRPRHLLIGVAAAVIGVPVAVVAVDAAVRWHPAPDSGIASRVAAAPDVDAYLAAREDSVSGVKPALRKGIVWRDAARKTRTPLSIIYLHGFSASRAELSPVIERLADSLGANLFFTRFTAHGRVDGEAFATLKPQQLVDDAREAFAIGRRIGDRVIVIATSSGVPPALQVVSESANSIAPAALIFVSPNHEPADRRARFAAGPFGPLVARLISGRYREFTAENAAHAELWTPRYRVEGVSALMDVVLHAQTIDVSKIRAPLLTLYTRHDNSVNLDLVRSRHAEFGSPIREIVDVAEATRHEMASAALAPQAVDPVVALMLRFVRVAVGGTSPPAAAPLQAAPARRLLLISFDGFRADYIARPAAKRLRELAARGVRAERLRPAFPAKTYPNHYTIVTGLYPAHHGIVANTMWESSLGGFDMGDNPAVRDARWWWGEPIWVTAEKQGMRAASYFWPGSDAAIDGVRPHWYYQWDAKVSRAERVRKVLEWLAMPADSAPRMITTYFAETDGAGHNYGPGAPQVDSAIAQVDSVLGALVGGIARLGLTDAVDLMVVSDHGMAPARGANAIALDDFVSLDSLRVVDWTPVTAIIPKPGAEAYVYDRLHGAHPKLDVWRKAELPARFHYDGARVAPIIGLAAEGWIVSSRARLAKSPPRVNGGEHGYDNDLPSMQALFVAAGPSFRRGITVPSLDIIHLYPLMAQILGLRPAKTDGSLDSVRALLRP